MYSFAVWFFFILQPEITSRFRRFRKCSWWYLHYIIRAWCEAFNGVRTFVRVAIRLILSADASWGEAANAYVLGRPSVKWRGRNLGRAHPFRSHRSGRPTASRAVGSRRLMRRVTISARHQGWGDEAEARGVMGRSEMGRRSLAPG